MLTYNRPQLIARAIQSVVEQDLESWELIVVHDGPNQETARTVGVWQDRDARVRYFHRPLGGNIANALNHGILQARGEYIAILDDDDCWAEPAKLSKQTEFLDTHPEYVACGGGVIVMDEQGIETLRYFKSQEDAPLRCWALLANPIAHSTAMYRRADIVRSGLYDETLEGFQDWDVFLRLGRGGKLYNFAEPLACYTIWHGGGSFKQHRANTRSALIIVKRHGRAYPRFASALMLAGLHYGYARLPEFMRLGTFSVLSRAKKWLFSQRRLQTQA